MSVNNEFSKFFSDWTQHPVSHLMTDKGCHVVHIDGRKIRLSNGDVYEVNDDGKCLLNGVFDKTVGRLPVDLVDVTDQLRLLWLEEVKLGDNYISLYDEKNNLRREKYILRSINARKEGEIAHQRANAMLAVIPLGQPILIGHHSEKRHRKLLDKADRIYRHAFVECFGKEKYYKNKADGVGNGGISSDDPHAIRKLLEKLKSCIENQFIMKLCNAAIRKNKTHEEQLSALVKLGESLGNANKLLSGDVFGNIGFPSYSLQGNNAEIKRIKLRIKELKSLKFDSESDFECEFFSIKVDKEDNRILFLFDGKPDENSRSILKKHAFKWSPTRNAWVRKITSNALADTKIIKIMLIDSFNK